MCIQNARLPLTRTQCTRCCSSCCCCCCNNQVYVSTKNKNPGPFEFEWKDETNGTKHLIVTTGGAESNVYVGILGTGCVCDAQCPVSSVTVDVYNDLFELSNQAASVAEGAAIGTKVYTVPKHAGIDGIPNLGLRFSIANVWAGPSTTPFGIDQVSGVVTMNAVTDCGATQQVWDLHIDAKATSTTTHEDLEQCLRGGINLKVTIACGVYCGASQRLTGKAPKTACTACAVGQCGIMRTYDSSLSHTTMTHHAVWHHAQSLCTPVQHAW